MARSGDVLQLALCNNQSTSLNSLSHGAYDTSTFGDLPNRLFTDQPTHAPGARFWIPTLDEWIKATYYDPNHSGPGAGGWWQYPNSSDTPLVPGPPGIGQTNTGLTLPNFGHLDIPLGSYPDVRTPYGLLDASGGAAEWNEFIFLGDMPEWRAVMGTSASFGWEPAFDQLGTIFQQLNPGSPSQGLRIAAAVPAPGTFAIVIVCATVTVRRSRSTAGGKSSCAR